MYAGYFECALSKNKMLMPFNMLHVMILQSKSCICTVLFAHAVYLLGGVLILCKMYTHMIGSSMVQDIDHLIVGFYSKRNRLASDNQ